MVDKNTQAVIEKIKKCIRLGASSNAHEAAVAISMAQRMMDSHQITENDILISEVSEAAVSTGRNTKPPQWLSNLIYLVSAAFGVKSIISRKWDDSHCYVKFVGVNQAPELAGYTFAVVYRQLKRARAEFLKKTRGKKTNRTRKADLYALAFVDAIGNKVHAFAGTEKDIESIDAYMARNYQKLTEYKPKEVTVKKRDISAIMAGHLDGMNVNLRHAVSGQEVARLGEE